MKRTGRILVTGATGFLGRHLLDVLLERGEKHVRVLASSAAPELRERGLEIVEGSILSTAALERAVDGASIVCHLAGRVSRSRDDQRDLFAVHVEGTRLLCEAARSAGVKRIVLASSSGTMAVTEDGRHIPDETWPTPLHLIARWPYYASKLYQEQIARRTCQGGPDLVILNPSLILGPGDARLSSTGDVLRFLAREIPIVPSGGLSFVDVRDVAAAFHAAIRRGRPGERYLLGGANWTFERFFGRLGRVAKVPAPRLRVPGRALEWGSRAVDALYRHWGKVPSVDPISLEMSRYFWYVDSSKATRELGFAARDPGETLYETVAYLQAQFLGAGLSA